MAGFLMALQNITKMISVSQCQCCIDKLCLCFTFRFQLVYCKCTCIFTVQWVKEKKKKIQIKKRFHSGKYLVYRNFFKNAKFERFLGSANLKVYKNILKDKSHTRYLIKFHKFSSNLQDLVLGELFMVSVLQAIYSANFASAHLSVFTEFRNLKIRRSI